MLCEKSSQEAAFSSLPELRAGDWNRFWVVARVMRLRIEVCISLIPRTWCPWKFLSAFALYLRICAGALLDSEWFFFFFNLVYCSSGTGTQGQDSKRVIPSRLQTRVKNALVPISQLLFLIVYKPRGWNHPLWSGPPTSPPPIAVPQADLMEIVPPWDSLPRKF